VYNRPWRFLQDDANVKDLTQELSRVGIRQVTRRGDRLICECPWLPTPVEITWLLQWCSDGMDEEDDRVVVSHAGAAVATVDMSLLLRTRHSRPLRRVVVDALARACATVTGKTLPARDDDEAHDVGEIDAADGGAA